MADSDYKTQVSATEAANTLANPMFMQLSDGSAALSVTAGVLDVNAVVTLETAYADNSTEFTLNTSDVNAQGYLVDETAFAATVTEGNIGLARMTANRIVLTNIESDAGNRLVIDGSGFPTVNVNGTVTVSATDLDIRDLTHVSDSVRLGDGTTLTDVLSATNNALYVAVTDGTNTLAPNADGSINVVVAGASGTKVHDYDHAVATGSGASTNHDYTVVGSIFSCTGILVSASGKGRYEIQFGPIASLATVAVGFLDKDETKFIEFSPALDVPVASTGTLRVIKENRQGTATDFYSTIQGTDA